MGLAEASPNHQSMVEELKRTMAARLPQFMHPRYIEFLEQLPYTGTNKLQRRFLGGINGRTWDDEREDWIEPTEATASNTDECPLQL